MSQLDHVYKSPRHSKASKMAILTNRSRAIKIISIDGKSVSYYLNKAPIMLVPGKHVIYCYVGKNNYLSEKNVMMVLTVTLKSNKKYFMQAASNGKIWIQDDQGKKINAVKSSMTFDKSMQI